MTFVKWLIYSCCFLFAIIATGQSAYPVKWTYQYKKISKSTYDIYFTAKIDAGYRLFGALDANDGPIGFLPWHENIKNLTVAGKTKSVASPVCEYDKMIEMDFCYFKNEVTYIQRIKLTKPKRPASMTIYYEFMVDNKELQKSLPPIVHCIKVDIPSNASMKINETSDKHIINCTK